MASREVRPPTAHAMRHCTQSLKSTPDPASFAVRVSLGTCSVIELSGELDLAGVPLLESAVQDLGLPRVRAAVLDLRQLTFIDAVGLNGVAGVYAECLKVGATLTIIPGPRNVQRLFELTRLDRLLPFSDPLEREERPCLSMRKPLAIEKRRV